MNLGDAAGSWKPAVNLSTVLASVQQLIADPNPDDGLVPEITQEFKQNRALYESTARSHTARYAVDTRNATIRGSSEISSAHDPCPEKEGQAQRGNSHAAASSMVEEVSDADSEDEEEDLQSLWGEIESHRYVHHQTSSNALSHMRACLRVYTLHYVQIFHSHAKRL